MPAKTAGRKAAKPGWEVRVGREVHVAVQLGGLGALGAGAVLEDAGRRGHCALLAARAEVCIGMLRQHHVVVLVVRPQEALHCGPLLRESMRGKSEVDS